jgi:WD40 repeat protein
MPGNSVSQINNKASDIAQPTSSQNLDNSLINCMAASASLDETVWDSAKGAAHRTLEGHLKSVLAMVFSPDSKLVASGSSDEAFRPWDLASS